MGYANGVADNKSPASSVTTSQPASGLNLPEKQTMNCKFTLLGGGPAASTRSAFPSAPPRAVCLVISAQQGGVPAGAIPGKYTGLRADASVGVGLAENIGGNNSAFMFQPTS